MPTASLGDSQVASLAGLPPNDHAQRLEATGLAYREWALAYPQRYLLIFGTPLPGYHAPEEITQPVAARSLRPLIERSRRRLEEWKPQAGAATAFI